MANGFTFEDKSGIVKKIMDAAAKQAMEAATLFIEGQAKSLAPVDSGELRDKIDHKVGEKGGNIIGTVGSPMFYAPYVEYGKKPVPYKNRAKSVEVWEPDNTEVT